MEHGFEIIPINCPSCKAYHEISVYIEEETEQCKISDGLFVCSECGEEISDEDIN